MIEQYVGGNGMIPLVVVGAAFVWELTSNGLSDLLFAGKSNAQKVEAGLMKPTVSRPGDQELADWGAMDAIEEAEMFKQRTGADRYFVGMHDLSNVAKISEKLVQRPNKEFGGR